MSNRAGKGECYQPTQLEQVCNSITHGISIIPAIVAVYMMLQNSSTQVHQLCALWYGISLIMLFTISTTYHVLSLVPSIKNSIWLRVFHLGDRFMIYIFIASSYMPWLLLQNFTDFGVQVAYGIWSAAIAGIVYSIFFHNKYKTLETAFYLCLGFLPAVPLAYKSLRGLLELAFGGLFYVLGVFFFKSDGNFPCAHSIWHLLGSVGAWTHHYAIWKHFYQ